MRTLQNSSPAGIPHHEAAMDVGVPFPVSPAHSHSAYVANPSLSQVSCHVSTETLSPYHSWASSCATTNVPAFLRKNSRLYRGRVWFSRATPVVWSSTTPPSASNGYGPNFDCRNRTMRTSWPSAKSASSPTSGSTASTTGSPDAVRGDRRSPWPVGASGRWLPMGPPSTHRHVVHPPCVALPARRPFETASTPSGTVISMSYEALSRGWSFTGNHAAATSGSPQISAPSSVGTTPVSTGTPGIRNVAGMPEYRATTST